MKSVFHDSDERLTNQRCNLDLCTDSGTVLTRMETIEKRWFSYNVGSS